MSRWIQRACRRTSLILVIASATLSAGLSALAAPTVEDQALTQAAQMLVTWQEETAASLLEPLVKKGVKSKWLTLFWGESLFALGRYDAAENALSSLDERGDIGRRVDELLPLVRAVKKAVKGHLVHRSAGGRFRILTPAGRDEVLARMAGQTLEAAAAALQRDLGYIPPSPVRVEVYPDHATLASVSPLTEKEIEQSGTVALCKYNRLMIVTPRALLRGYAWRDALAHEYVHMVVSRLSHNTVPVWLHEGLAKYLESRWRLSGAPVPLLTPAQEHLLADAMRREQLVTWERMHPSMAKLPDQRTATLAFAQAQTAVDHIASTRGGQALRRLLLAFRQAGPGWDAIEQVTGMNRDAFDRSWRAHIARLKPRPFSGLVQPSMRFGKPGSTETKLLAVKKKNARNYIRLGEMLRSRGRVRAAAVEYRKARAILGKRDPFVAGLLARVLLARDDWAGAVASLAPVLEYYPNDGGTRVAMGTARLVAGENEAAADHFRAALGINPFDPRVHCGMARVLPSGDEAAFHTRYCAEFSRR